MEQESLSHMLFTCPFAQQVWFTSQLSLRSDCLSFSSFPQLWILLSTQLITMQPSMDSFTLFCFTLWHLWKSRNAIIFREEYISIEDTVLLASKACSEYILVLSLEPHTSNISSSTLTAPISFASLPQDCVKINVDAATDKQHHFGVVAAIARNSTGLIIGKFTAVFRAIWDPGILEFLAMREALNWAISNRWHSVLLEGDALQVIQSIQKPMVQISEFSTF
ncbi:uncharacterized protein LOC126673877 [Mercurialis annua]|uniref:uncharacterized protein LOC126673877 n=1 Tax=Mercurialis annua TaxID=3986 RepID=UPI0024AFD0A7|nr:uncharacterized protein LOC126673877 [Mercurialis annua]